MKKLLMKKIISLFVAVLLLCALTVPAMAMDFSGTVTIPGGSYDAITTKVYAKVTINSEVTLSNGGNAANLSLDSNSTLVIGSKGFLTGTKVTCVLSGPGQRIELEEGGGLYIEFVNSTYATNFENLLNNSGITFTRNGNTFQAGACYHNGGETTVTVITKETICDLCGKTVSTETTETVDPAPTASTLSEGNLAVVCTVAAAVVFGLGGFILGTKKKKPALANSEDE